MLAKYSHAGMFGCVDLVQIYECLCDTTRLRLLNLLRTGPLCVCHFQEILEEPQVKISKHLGYLKRRGLVTAQREGHWVIYSLPDKPSRELSANLACLQDCVAENPLFLRDLKRLQGVDTGCASGLVPNCGCETKRN